MACVLQGVCVDVPNMLPAVPFQLAGEVEDPGSQTNLEAQLVVRIKSPVHALNVHHPVGSALYSNFASPHNMHPALKIGKKVAQGGIRKHDLAELSRSRILPSTPPGDEMLEHHLRSTLNTFTPRPLTLGPIWAPTKKYLSY